MIAQQRIASEGDHATYQKGRGIDVVSLGHLTSPLSPDTIHDGIDGAVEQPEAALAGVTHGGPRCVEAGRRFGLRSLSIAARRRSRLSIRRT
jgi:hypothetical protein